MSLSNVFNVGHRSFLQKICKQLSQFICIMQQVVLEVNGKNEKYAKICQNF
jgi:hypothetical protein